MKIEINRELLIACYMTTNKKSVGRTTPVYFINKKTKNEDLGSDKMSNDWFVAGLGTGWSETSSDTHMLTWGLSEDCNVQHSEGSDKQHVDEFSIVLSKEAFPALKKLKKLRTVTLDIETGYIDEILDVVKEQHFSYVQKYDSLYNPLSKRKISGIIPSHEFSIDPEVYGDKRVYSVVLSPKNTKVVNDIAIATGNDIRLNYYDEPDRVLFEYVKRDEQVLITQFQTIVLPMQYGSDTFLHKKNILIV